MVQGNGKGRGSESNLNKVWDIGVGLMIPLPAAMDVQRFGAAGGEMEILVFMRISM